VAGRVPQAYAHRAACLVLPWELPRRGAACLLVPCCRDHRVRRHCRGVAGTAKADHRDAALAHHQDDPAARCWDDTVAERQLGACLAAHPGALARGLKEALQDAMDNVARSKVHQQGAEPRALPPQDVRPQTRSPVLQAAEARQAAAQMMQARRRDVRL
jgi:hypothetical protein